MDATALSLCMENDLPIHVFNMDDASNIGRIVSGARIGTLVSSGAGAAPLPPHSRIPGATMMTNMTTAPARGATPGGTALVIDDVMADAKTPHGQDDRVDAQRVRLRPHRARLGGAARPHPGVVLRHPHAAQPARAGQRARAAA